MNEPIHEEASELNTTLVVVLDHQGRILFFNKACEIITGLLFRDVQGKELLELLTIEEEKQLVRDLYTNYDPDLLPRKIQIHVPAKNGKEKLIKWSSSIILNKDHAIDRIICYGKEIVGIKLPEEVQNTANETSRGTTTRGVDAVLVSDIHGRLLDVNEPYTLMTGYSRQDIHCMTLYDVVAEKKPADIPVLIKDIISCGCSQLKWRLKSRDDMPVNVEVNIQYVNINDGLLFCSIRKIGDLVEKNTGEVKDYKNNDIKISIPNQIIDNTTDSIFIYDFNGNFIYVNAPAYRSRGYSKEEIMSMSMYDLCPYDEIRILGSHIKEIAVKEKTSGQMIHRCKDGTDRDVELHSRIIHINNRKLILSSVQDVTEYNKLKKRYQSIIATCPYGVVILRDDGKIIDYNDYCCQLFGYNRNELHDMKISDFDSSDQIDSFSKLITRIKEEKSGHLTCRLIRKNGESINIEATASCIDNSSFFLFIKDITDHIRTLENMKEQVFIRESRLADNIDKGLLFLDQNDCISYVNTVAADVLNCATADILGQKLIDLITHDYKNELEMCLHPMGNNGGKPLNLHIKGKNSDKISVCFAAVPLLNKENKYIGSIVFCSKQNITITNNNIPEPEVGLKDITLSLLKLDTNRIQSLQEMNLLIQSCLNAGETYKLLSHFLPLLFPNAAGILYILNNTINLYESVISWGNSLESEIIFDAGACWAVRRGKPHCVRDFRNEEICGHIDRLASRHYTDIPLINCGKHFGVLHIEELVADDVSRIEVRADHPGEEDIFGTLVTQQLACILANIELRKCVNVQAVYDSITGLYSRSYMEQLLEREIHIACRNKSLAGLILIEMDDIKKFNGIYGYRMSDLLMKKTGEYIKKLVRPEDIVCSYRDDSFAVIMPATTNSMIKQHSEIICDKIRNISKEYQNLPFSITKVSSGIAVFPMHGATSEEIIKRAHLASWDSMQKNTNEIKSNEDVATRKMC